MANLYRPLTAFTLTAGHNTAYTAPSGTAVMIAYIRLSTNITGTAANTTAVIKVGPTAGLVTILNVTAISASGSYENTNKIALESASWGVVISAHTGGAVDVYIAGLRMN